MDTPGIVSIVARSQDEQVALSALSSLDTVIGTSYRSPHLLVVLLDATQPARHLPLVREVIKAGFPTVVALTMNDLARKKAGIWIPTSSRIDWCTRCGSGRAYRSRNF